MTSFDDLLQNMPAIGGDAGEGKRQHFRLPGILSRLLGPHQFEEVPDLPGRRRFAVGVVNTAGSYDLVAQEDATFIVFGAELARVESEPSVDFLRALNEINCAIPEAKLVVEQDVPDHKGENFDSIQLTKQLRKRGVPESVVVAELASFDAGVKKAAEKTTRAARETGTRLMIEGDSHFTETPVVPQNTLSQLEAFIRRRG